jgi:ATP:cob(I)alamin adenosyltransferase
MVKLNVIYTRTGDKGETGLGDGSRRPKNDARVAAMGDVDEANCAIGLALLAVRNTNDAADLAIEPVLTRVQNDLFDLGADLCLPRQANEKAGAVLRVAPSQVQAIEHAIDVAKREPPSAALVRAAGRHSGRRRLASGARNLPAGGASHGRARRDRGRGSRRGRAAMSIACPIICCRRARPTTRRSDVLWAPRQSERNRSQTEDDE